MFAFVPCPDFWTRIQRFTEIMQRWQLISRAFNLNLIGVWEHIHRHYGDLSHYLHYGNTKMADMTLLRYYFRCVRGRNWRKQTVKRPQVFIRDTANKHWPINWCVMWLRWVFDILLGMFPAAIPPS
jgi:hypothetical protein